MKNIRIKLTFSDNSPDDENTSAQASLEDYINAENTEDPAVAEYVTDGFYTAGNRCELIYKENEEFDMGEGSIKVSWLADDPEIITVMRSGEVETVLTFETGMRHISIYNVQGMEFEMCTRTLKAENNFSAEKGSMIYLDYIIEVHGSFAGRRKMKIEVL